MTNPLDDPALNEGQPPPPTDAELGSIANLANRQKVLERDIADATSELKLMITEYWQIANHDLPNALRQAGSAGFTLTGGGKVEMRTQFDGSKLTSPEGLAWVEANGGGSLIKTVILLEMDRGDLEAAREILAELRQSRHSNKFKTLVLTEEVNPQTIAKFARELIEQRRDPDLQLLGVRRRSYAVVGSRPRTVDLKGFER
jgi:hypothetical protein